MSPALPPHLGATLVGAAIETLKARANEELQRIASKHATVPWLAAAAYEKQSVDGGWSFDVPRAVTGDSVAEVEATLIQLEEPCRTLPQRLHVVWLRRNGRWEPGGAEFVA